MSGGVGVVVARPGFRGSSGTTDGEDPGSVARLTVAGAGALFPGPVDAPGADPVAVEPVDGPGIVSVIVASGRTPAAGFRSVCPLASPVPGWVHPGVLISIGKNVDRAVASAGTSAVAGLTGTAVALSPGPGDAGAVALAGVSGARSGTSVASDCRTQLASGSPSTGTCPTGVAETGSGGIGVGVDTSGLAALALAEAGAGVPGTGSAGTAGAGLDGTDAVPAVGVAGAASVIHGIDHTGNPAGAGVDGAAPESAGRAGTGTPGCAVTAPGAATGGGASGGIVATVWKSAANRSVTSLPGLDRSGLTGRCAPARNAIIQSADAPFTVLPPRRA